MTFPRLLPLLAAAVLATPSVVALGIHTPQSYLVGYEPDAKSDVLHTLVRLTGSGDSIDAIDPLRVLRVTTPLDLTRLLPGTSGVSFVELDMPTRAAGAQWNGAQWNGAQWNGAQWNGAQWNGETASGVSGQWALDDMRAREAWATAGDAPVATCVVDSGIDATHPDLAARVRAPGYNALDGSTNAHDDAGHGTHMAGLIAAERDGTGIDGVSSSDLLSAKVLGADGRGKVGHLAEGMLWCADHDADVVLLALSVDGHSRTIDRAITYLAAHGIVVVASAGNDGGKVAYPARDPRIIAVAALAPPGDVAPFSAAGPEIALAAPGVDVLSDMVGGGFAYGSGTSQAAAHVAGAVALLLQSEPGLGPDAVRARLEASARDIGPQGRDDRSGAGALDLAALAEA